MTTENKDRVFNSLEKMEALTPSIGALIDTLAKISKEFTAGSGFQGDSVLAEAAGYLLGATAHLESASAGFLTKLQETKGLVAKTEREPGPAKDKE